MSNRTLAILGIALVALVVAATAPAWWPESDDAAGDPARSGAEVLALEGVDLGDASRIEVARPGVDEPIVAEREDGEWRVAGKAGDAASIESVLDALDAAAEADATLVARTEERQAGLGLAEDTAVRVTVQVDGDEHALLVGSGADVPDGSYVRRVDGDVSWQVEGGLVGALPADAAAWQVKPAAKDQQATPTSASKSAT